MWILFIVPKAYYRYKAYGAASIPCARQKGHYPFNEKDKSLINGIVDQCSKYSAGTLVEITQNQAHWRNAYAPNRTNEIPQKALLEYFYVG